MIFRTGERDRIERMFRVRPGCLSQEIKFFENIGSLESGREVVFQNSKQNAQIFWYPYESRYLLIFYNEEFDPGSG